RLGPLLPQEATDILSQISDAVAQGKASLQGPAHSLVLFSTTLPDESPETTAFMDKLNSLLPAQSAGGYYLLGNIPMAYEMAASFGQELTKMTLITAIAIFLVVLITFRSFLIPLLLVLMIQTAVYATMVIINLQGYSIYYLALLMVQSILMGATIDYAILYTGYYREFRRSMGKKEALSASYRGSMHTITTSGLIISIITWILGYAFPNPTIGEICFTISKGAACSLVLIILLLPGILAALDRWICKTDS
ncbi:MAG: MMPL family transporter, partial [Lachnospiraceae bacterium]|nr:MMPL family transporter [Lachnospiraceae bacterium]